MTMVPIPHRDQPFPPRAHRAIRDFAAVRVAGVVMICATRQLTGSVAAPSGDAMGRWALPALLAELPPLG
jgi:hypothetical protein